MKAVPGGTFLHILKLALVNSVGFFLLGYAYMVGLVDVVLEADKTNLSILIAGVFGVGVLASFVTSWRIYRDMPWASYVDDDLYWNWRPDSEVDRYMEAIDGHGALSRHILIQDMKMRFVQKTSFLRYLAGFLVILGLIGTVVGFVIALSAVEPSKVSDVTKIGPMISTLISGMSTALYTTLLGAVFNIWITINAATLSSALVNLASSIVQLGEDA